MSDEVNGEEIGPQMDFPGTAGVLSLWDSGVLLKYKLL
ncbi:hypothetical protein J2S17_003619 [Cytobacillus purgationiresistens]|uniref:Uncharacterized protein n=1 Tax=Cytobacillus purgationiresistens TaxID=863449 RepID=A0ABU0ALW5_9BACI|nr:hypothetical protein [Cytobacillus purgationiresistens]